LQHAFGNFEAGQVRLQCSNDGALVDLNARVCNQRDNHGPTEISVWDPEYSSLGNAGNTLNFALYFFRVNVNVVRHVAAASPLYGQGAIRYSEREINSFMISFDPP